MGEGTRTALLDKGRLDEEIVKRAEDAAAAAPTEERVRAGLEAAIEAAEADPAAARSALHRLRADHEALERLEAWLGGTPARTTFGLGAAIQVADAELGREVPELRGVEAELLRWLVGDW